MIVDRRFFSDNWSPHEILYRDTELERLRRRLLRPHDRPPHALLSGPSGVGKTLLAEDALDRVHARDAEHVHVDALGLTTGGVLRAVLEAHPDGPGSVPRTTPVEDVHEQLQATLSGRTIVVLDEADDVPSTEALSLLVDCEGVSVVAIAHDGREWLERLEPAVYEQFHPGHVPLTTYSVDQVADILERRVEHGLRGEPVERQQLETIGLAADGVAREAIATLEAAAELASERGHDVIRDADVEDAYGRARHKIRLSNVESLPYHHQVLYALIRDAGTCTGAELHERYDTVVEDVYRDVPQMPIGRRARRKKLPKLEDYDLIAIEGETSDRRYRVLDAAVEPPIEVSTLA